MGDTSVRNTSAPTWSPPVDPPDGAVRTLRAIAFVRGLSYVALGVAILVWPGRTLLVLAVIAGIQLAIIGILRIATAVVSDAEGWVRAVVAVLGVLTLLAGVICVRHPVASLTFVLVVVGIGWLVEGIAAVAGALTGRVSGLRGLYGVLSILAAISVLVWPDIGLATMALLLGWFFLLVGVTEIAAAVTSRSAAQHPVAAGTAS